MSPPSWFIELNRVHSSYLVLSALAALALVTGILVRFGLLGWVMRVLGFAVRWSMRRGFLLWERLLSWASWPLFLAIVFGFLAVGGVAGGLVPGLRIVCGLAPLFMGVIACLAYMFIDLERYRGRARPQGGPQPAEGPGAGGPSGAVWPAGPRPPAAGRHRRHGRRLRPAQPGPLRDHRARVVQGGRRARGAGLRRFPGVRPHQPAQHRGRAESRPIAPLPAGRVRPPGPWPASTLLALFKTFFTLVLLQQIFASLRQGKFLAETITDFWSPHEAIHERARNALPQYGAVAIGPLLVSLRSVPSLTKEQRDQLPLILATIGPSTIPALVRHLHDPHEHVRAIAAAALGRLHALDDGALAGRTRPRPQRHGAAEPGRSAGAPGPRAGASRPASEPRRLRGLGCTCGSGGWFRWKKRAVPAPLLDPVELAVATLESALADDSAAVRTQAALALGRIGPPAAAVAPGLIALLKDADETVRCQAAEALGQVGGERGGDGQPRWSSCCRTPVPRSRRRQRGRWGR